MKVLSWDIGIKNLAYCLVEYQNSKEEYQNSEEETKQINILDWNVINVMDNDNISTTHQCEFILPKKGTSCCKTAKHYMMGTWQTFCGTHMKKYPESDINLISKRKCAHISSKNKKCDKGIKFVGENGLEGYCSAHAKNIENISLTAIAKSVKKPSIHKISTALINRLDDLNFPKDIDIILIENQPVFKNPKMKSIQMILYTYFLIRYQIDCENSNLQIHFMMANNKLKVKLPNSEIQEKCEKETNQKFKTKYQRFKELAKRFCEFYISENENENEKEKKIWLNHYEKHKKKDDLADTYLMCIYYQQNSKKFKV